MYSSQGLLLKTLNGTRHGPDREKHPQNALWPKHSLLSACQAFLRVPIVSKPINSQLFDFGCASRFFNLGLDRLSLFFTDLLFDRSRSLIYHRLGLFQAQASNLPDGLDNVNFLFPNTGENNVKFGLLLSCFGRSGCRWSRCYRYRSRCAPNSSSSNTKSDSSAPSYF